MFIYMIYYDKAFFLEEISVLLGKSEKILLLKMMFYFHNTLQFLWLGQLNMETALFPSGLPKRLIYSGLIIHFMWKKKSV